jgi:hypothetical protein
MRRTVSHRLFGFALVASLCGCSVPAPAPPVAQPLDLAPRDARFAALFDDSVDFSVLGVSLDGGSPAMDPALPERTRKAELVGRATVVTLSREANGERARYRLQLNLAPDRFVSRGFPTRTLELTVGQDSPAFGLVNSQESTFRGLTIILFARRFAGEGGPELHWHITVNSEDVAKAIVARDLGAFSE